MAARKTRKKRATQLPKGFEPITGFGRSWPDDDTKAGALIRGVMTDFDEFETGKGKNKRTVQTVKVETDDGLLTLYESSGLRVLFDYEEGTEIAVIYDGKGKAKRGQSAPRLYRIGVM